MEVQWGLVAGNPIRILTYPYQYILCTYIAEDRFPVSPLCDMCKSWISQNTAETPHSQNCASQGCSWIAGQLFVETETKWLYVDGNFMIFYVMFRYSPHWNCHLRLPVTILGQSRCCTSLCVIGLERSPVPGDVELQALLPERCSAGFIPILYPQLMDCLECLQVHGSQHGSTASCSTFLWNCLYSSAFELWMWLVFAWIWIHEYKWLNNLCWIPLCNACPCGIWEICKIADDFGIGQSCETIQFLEMPWTACCRTLFVTSQHSLHTWLMQWTSPILGHADSVKLLWVAPCHLTNLFGARHNMILHMEVRAAFICHRTCCLAVTFHFT